MPVLRLTCSDTSSYSVPDYPGGANFSDLGLGPCQLPGRYGHRVYGHGGGLLYHRYNYMQEYTKSINQGRNINHSPAYITKLDVHRNLSIEWSSLNVTIWDQQIQFVSCSSYMLLQAYMTVHARFASFMSH